MKKIKYLTPILGLSAMVGVVAPVVTSCGKNVTTESTVVPTNLLRISGVTLYGFIEGADLTKYDTLDIPEGIEYIAPYAFYNGTSNAATDLTMITTLKLPASLRHVYSLAFGGLTNLKKIDLTSWDVDTISFIKFEDELLGETQYWAFNPEFINNYKSCYVELPAGLPAEFIKEAKTKLNSAGIPEWWFVEQTTGHVSATPDKEKVQEATQDSSTTFTILESYAPAENYLTLSEVFDITKYELAIYPEITECTDEDADKLILGEFELGSDNKTINIPSAFFASEQGGDEISYSFNVICRRIDTDEIVWSEKVTDYKLTYVYTHVESVTLQDKDFSLCLKDPITAKSDFSTKQMTAPVIMPENACNPSYAWTTGDSNVATIDEDGLATCTGFGETTVSAVAEDGGISGSVNVSVGTAMIGESTTEFKSGQYAVAQGSTVKYQSYTLNESLPALYKNDEETRTFKVVDKKTGEPIKFASDKFSIKVVDNTPTERVLSIDDDYAYDATTGIITFHKYDDQTTPEEPTGVYLATGYTLIFTFTFDEESTGAQLMFATAA